MMNKKIFLYILILLIVFMYGLTVGTTKIFPYNQIKSIKIYLIGDNRVSSTIYYYQKRFYELLFISDYKIVMLGDSITDHVNWNDISHRNDILNRGISGDISDGLLWKLESLPVGLKKAFIMIGVNDLARGNTVEHILNNYKKIIEILIKKNITPFIQSTLYVGSDIHNRNNKDIEYLNTYLRTYANRNNIIFIDLNKVMSINKTLKDEYTIDGIHLNKNGYYVWINEIKKYF